MYPHIRSIVLIAALMVFGTVSADTVNITNSVSAVASTGGNSANGTDGADGTDGKVGTVGTRGVDGTAGSVIEGKATHSVSVTNTVNGKVVDSFHASGSQPIEYSHTTTVVPEPERAASVPAVETHTTLPVAAEPHDGSLLSDVVEVSDTQVTARASSSSLGAHALIGGLVETILATITGFLYGIFG
jgi:hypothetical protein